MLLRLLLFVSCFSATVVLPAQLVIRADYGPAYAVTFDNPQVVISPLVVIDYGYPTEELIRPVAGNVASLHVEVGAADAPLRAGVRLTYFEKGYQLIFKQQVDNGTRFLDVYTQETGYLGLNPTVGFPVGRRFLGEVGTYAAFPLRTVSRPDTTSPQGVDLGYTARITYLIGRFYLALTYQQSLPPYDFAELTEWDSYRTVEKGGTIDLLSLSAGYTLLH